MAIFLGQIPNIMSDIDLSIRDLTEVPTDIPTNATTVDLSHNILVILHSDTFIQLSNLTRLYLDTWWRHQMETFSALLALCAGNSPVPVNSPHKGQWRGALMFSLIYAWINDWVNNREAGDLRRHWGHYDVIVMNNKIATVQYGAFRGLNKLSLLRLQHNRLSAMPDISGLSALIYLYISYNDQIKSFNATVFSSMTRLNALSTAYTGVSSVPYFPAIKLRNLYLGRNRIATLQPRSFQALKYWALYPILGALRET